MEAWGPAWSSWERGPSAPHGGAGTAGGLRCRERWGNTNNSEWGGGQSVVKPVSGELDQDAYMTEKQSCDNEMQQIQNTMHMIAARQQEAQENMETEAIRNEVMSAESLTQAMAEKVIKKVTVFHDHRIEIEYAVQDFLKGGNSASEGSGG